MSFGKRKRHSKELKCIYFPDEVKNSFKRVGGESSISASSVTKSWGKCGDSFLDTPVIKNIWSSGKKLSGVRKLAPSSAPVLYSTSGCNQDPVHIAWSSSEGEQSDSEAQQQQQQPAPSLVRKEPLVCPRRPARPTAPIQSYSRALRMLSTETDELPSIDWDSEPNESEDEEDRLGGISDCQSESCDEQTAEAPKPTALAETEISDYTSDGESAADDTVTQSRPESFPLQTGEGSRRSVSDWVRLAQAMLQTPQKQRDRQSKTPEDSSKKRRKFQSGGLAERLNRLQCRQRSAISFWRHQSISDSTVTTVDKPGVLPLEVLSVWEESCMQLALCEQQQQEAPTEQPRGPPPPTTTTATAPAPRARVLVLFNKETAAQLRPTLRDVLHVYPPWQSLVIEGEDRTVVLNTHFSQKVFSESKPASVPLHRTLLPAEKSIPYSLTRSFGLLEMNQALEEEGGPFKPMPALQGPSCPWGLGGVCDSLLEAIEGLGQAGSVGQEVEVVVQRVYSAPLQEHSPTALLRPKVPCRSPSAPTVPKAKSRLCLLVQDGYGTFSVVQLQPLPREEHQQRLQRYSQTWQGRTCLLGAIKVVQRVTRERCSRLFSLIDSLWPPAVQLKVHGGSHGPEKDSRPAGPAPSFCYLLSGQEGSVELMEGRGVSPLYRPPTHLTLAQILQSAQKGYRCSFTATVVYQRTQNADMGLAEYWLAVTDPSLQRDPPEEQCSRRTLTMRLSTSCVVPPSVSEALLAPSVCHLSITDAVLEHDVLLCADQSVVQLHSLTEPVCSTENVEESRFLTQAQNQNQTQLWRLDPLGPETTPSSVCTLSGVIVGVDEDTAYSWPVCSVCKSDHLENSPEKPQAFHCVSCDSTVDQPTMKMQLEAFLRTSLSDCTVKIKLQQSTIMRILNPADSDTEVSSLSTVLSRQPLTGASRSGLPVNYPFPGYEVENVLGKEVGPLTAYVRVVTRKPALWVGLEEICLAEPGRVRRR